MKKLLPVLILLLAAAIVALLFFFKPEPDSVAPERPVTQVEVDIAQPTRLQLSVTSQGTVMPKIETDLAVEVSGRIIEMSPRFRVGGRFQEDDLLFRIDPADYEAAVAAAEAELATAQLALEQEKALAEQALADWEAMGQGEPSDLTLRKPQLAQVRARIKSARAALRQARRDLSRTEVRAPYAGRVLRKSVDLGQYVVANPANPVARIYATGSAEVRLPITLREVDFLIDPEEGESAVTLRRDAIKQAQTWQATLLRFESTIDPESRLLYAIAGIEAPFDQGLRRGLFVEAELFGKTVDGVYEIPRHALREANQVYVVTPEQELVSRQVDILKSDATRAIITSGLSPGDRIATSPIAFFVENMPVEILPLAE